MVAGSSEQYRRVLKVKVTSLFGLYDHEISLNRNDRITIIHGPNGVGKTVLLRMISSLFGGRYADIADVPFSSMAVWLDGDASINVVRERAEEGGEASLPGRQSYSLYIEAVTNGVVCGYRLPALSSNEYLAIKIARDFPYMIREGRDQWVDERDGEILSSDELIERFAGRYRQSQAASEEEPEEIRRLRETVQTHVIEAQRLIQLSFDAHRYPRRSGISRMDTTVKKYSDELKQRLSEATARYAAQSQSLDQTFPRRLITLSAHLTPSELRSELDSLDKATEKLSELGLLTLTQSYPVSITELDRLDDAQRRVMTLYVQDTGRKLGVLTELADRVQLLLDSVNAKFRNKTVSVNKSSGILIKGQDGLPIELDALSSGEQHELVLLYDLLFRVRPNTLVLIDEPELSLHVTWQKRFLPELLAIVSKAKFDAVVATHSPFIVGGRRDLMVALDADPDNQDLEGVKF